MEPKGVLMDWGKIERVTSSITPLLFQALRGERTWRDVMVEFLRLYVREGDILSAFFSMLVDDDVLIGEAAAKLLEYVNGVGIGGTIISLDLDENVKLALRLERPLEMADLKVTTRTDLRECLKKVGVVVKRDEEERVMSLPAFILNVVLWDALNVKVWADLSFCADTLVENAPLPLQTVLLKNTFEIRPVDEQLRAGEEVPRGKKRRI